jgi:hypothetical protein
VHQSAIETVGPCSVPWTPSYGWCGSPCSSETPLQRRWLLCPKNKNITKF